MPIISVTKEDIENGETQSKYSCPIALALKRAEPAASIHVYKQHLKVDSVIYELSPRIQTFIAYFDNGLPVEPFEFSLEGLTRLPSLWKEAIKISVDEI